MKLQLKFGVLFHTITTWRPRHKGRVNQQSPDRKIISLHMIAHHGDQRQLKPANFKILKKKIDEEVSSRNCDNSITFLQIEFLYHSFFSLKH
jgi:hypothetical protein